MVVGLKACKKTLDKHYSSMTKLYILYGMDLYIYTVPNHRYLQYVNVHTYRLTYSAFAVGWTLKLNLRDESLDSKVSEFFFSFFFDRGQDLYYYSKFLQLHLNHGMGRP